MAQNKDDNVLRVPSFAPSILWCLSAFLLFVTIYVLVKAWPVPVQNGLNGLVAISGPSFMGIWFGYMALRLSLWRVRLMPTGLEWRWFFTTRAINFSDINVFDCEIRRSAKGGRVGYFIIKLKAGNELISPPLGVPLASTLAEKATKHLDGHRARLFEKLALAKRGQIDRPGLPF